MSNLAEAVDTNKIPKHVAVTAKLDKVTDEMVIAKAAKKGKTLTAAVVAEARVEVEESFNKTLAGTNESTTEHVYEPLVNDGETVQGARVYKCAASQGVKCHCRACTGDEKAAVALVKTFDFRPGAIVERLNLLRPIYRKTTNYGHFGKAQLAWEK
jgi:hypothetical protein